MHALVRSVNSAALPTLTNSRAADSTPVTIAGMIGVPVTALTCARLRENGSAPSRDIENIILVAAVWIASVQTQMATVTSTRKILPTVEPSREVRTYGSPWGARWPWG